MHDIESLRKDYLDNYEEDGISDENIKTIERKLGIILPDDFKKIATFFNGGEVGAFDLYNFYFDENEYNIVDETLRLRESISLPMQYVVLAEMSESIILMNVKSQPAIIWCDSYDVENIVSGNELNNPDLWDSYSAFFASMLES